MEDDEALARALQDLEYRNQTARMNNNTSRNNSATPNNHRPGTSARRVMSYRNNATRSQAPPPQAQARSFPVANSTGTPVVTGTAIPATNNTNTAATTTTTVAGRSLRQPPASSSSIRRNNQSQDPPATTTSRSKASASSSRKSNNSKKSSRSVKSNKSSKTTRSSAKNKNTNSNSNMITPIPAPTISSSATTSQPTTYDLLSAPNESTSTSAGTTAKRQQQQPEGRFVSLDNVFPSSQTAQQQQGQQAPPRSKSKTPRKSKSSRSSSQLVASTTPREPSPSRTQQRGSSKTPNKANLSTSSTSSTKRRKSTTKYDKASSGNTVATSASSGSMSRQQQQQQATVAALPPPNSYQQQQQARVSRSTAAEGTPTSRATSRTKGSRSTSRSRPKGVSQQGSTSSSSRQVQPAAFATTSAPPPTNPAATSSMNGTPQRATVIPMTLPPPSRTPTPSTPTAVTMSDEEYARQLAQQFRNENGIQPSPPKQEAVAAVIPPLKLSESQENKLTDEEYARKLAQEYRSDVGIPPSPTSVASLEDPGEEIENIETAKKVAQELEDEELALRITQADLDAEAVQRIARAEALRGTNQGYVQTEADIIAHQAAVANGELVIAPPQPQPWWRRLLRCLMPIGVFIAVGLGLWFAFGGNNGSGWPGLPTIGDNDPFDGVNPSETSQWEASKNKNGLSLEVLDGLDQQWEGLFHTAMSDWENGTPDALSLTRKDIGYDGNCDHVELKMKVCNGNYDDTGWRGINQVMINHKGWIVSSIAKVNDFYLKNADNDQRRYTMCHEIGHGFGLPHTDENFFNKDLGNCMDYTNKPHNNLTPDDSNFNLLAEWYGEVTETRRVSEGDENQKLDISSEVPESAWKESMEAAKMLESGDIVDLMNDAPRHSPSRTLQWELVHKSADGIEFRMELSSGYVMIAHALLAEPLV
mmetsp:Transcript_18106/g.27986  ORF Transcript_18106/g.27986 Transcript_18106/m.27986 type:complete len:929 (-) Transcript_18106:115-2901(-)